MKTAEIIMIPVTDQQKAKAYYLSLGFRVIAEAPDGHGGVWLQMGLPGESTSLSLARFHGIIFQTEDIGSEVDGLRSKGIEVGKIDDTPWGKFAWLKDPDGNGLCLHQK
ncbi:MAG: VOC family protein [Bacteroidetes bacterium]|nr:VOC family protein [Bacteroidota bacterium]